jgi:chromosome segregation ATPase
MGSLNGRLDRLEGRIGIPKPKAEQQARRMSEKRERVIAELEALEAHIKSMSKAEREAWRNDRRLRAAIAEREAELERRRRGEP